MVAVRRHPPPDRPRGDASDVEAVVARADADTERTQAVRHALDAVRLLDAELGRAGQVAVAAGAAGGEREERQLVDESRHLLGGHVRRSQLGRVHLEVADELTAGLAAVEDGDAGAHPLEHVEQARAPRIQTDVVDRQVGAREQGGRDDERRRGREVARDLHLAEREARCGLDRDRPGAPAHARAGRCEHQLGVIACRRRLDHGRRAVGADAREQHRGLHLRARDRQRVLDPLERVAPFDHQRIGGDTRAHAVERLGDPAHRTRAQGLVACQLVAAGPAREDPRQ